MSCDNCFTELHDIQIPLAIEMMERIILECGEYQKLLDRTQRRHETLTNAAGIYQDELTGGQIRNVYNRRYNGRSPYVGRFGS